MLHIAILLVQKLHEPQITSGTWKEYLLFIILKNLSRWLDAFTWSLILNLLMLIMLMLLQYLQYAVNIFVIIVTNAQSTVSVLFYFNILYRFSPSLIYLFIGSATLKKKVNMFSSAISPSVSLPAQAKEGFVYPSLGCKDHSKFLNIYILFHLFTPFI